MLQLVQSPKIGTADLIEVPSPNPGAFQVLVRNSASLVSVGTEKYMLEFARKSILAKALHRPDLVKQVIDKAITEGIGEAYRQSQGRLSALVPLGYSSAGTVIDVGAQVSSFRVGDRVACSGSGFASHAEQVAVPQNFCVPVPESVPFESAAFVAVGGIALEAIRLANVSMGSNVVVVGMGLIGQIAVQLLRASGCHVFGIDPDDSKVLLAKTSGAEFAASDFGALLAAVREATLGEGADAILIFAATASSEPLQWAAELSRERAKVVAGGLIGMEVPRKLFYEKELELAVSRAWGPGVYDPAYLEQKSDYPIAHARWSAARNMAEFIAQLAGGSINTQKLVSHAFAFESAPAAYELITSGKERYLGVLLKYSQEVEAISSVTVILRPEKAPDASTTLGIIGAGQFARGTLFPILKKRSDVNIAWVATAGGLSARHAAEQLNAEACTTDCEEVLQDPRVQAVLILTRHGSHAEFVCRALSAGKHVFVEKPLALNESQLTAVRETFDSITGEKPILLVGYNRRFSKFATWLKGNLRDVTEPLGVHCTVNAGRIPHDSWVHDSSQGGGRVIGEICHFVDLIQFLTGSLPVRVQAESISSRSSSPTDNVVVTLKMANGSLGSISYLSGGDKRYPRERVEVMGGNSVGVIENFRAATFIRRGRTRRTKNLFSVDRGHSAELLTFLTAIRQGTNIVPFEEHVATSLTTFAIEEALRTGAAISIPPGNKLRKERAQCVSSF